MSEASHHLHLCREARADGKVESCLHHSRLAAQAAEDERDWETRWHALAAPGRLYLNQANPWKAEEHYHEAPESVKEHGPVHLLGGAYHDLYLCAREMGNDALQKRWLALAFELYPWNNARLAGLVADMAYAHRERDGGARHLVEASKGCIAALSERRDFYFAHCVMAWCWGTLGQRDRFLTTWGGLVDAYEDLGGLEGFAWATAEAVEGAIRMQEFGKAYWLAALAEQKAESRGEEILRQRLSYLRDCADSGKLARC